MKTEAVKSRQLQREEENSKPIQRLHRRKTALIEVTARHMYRRAFSEVTLLDALGQFRFEEGISYHFITAGDVDSLSYLKAILRTQNLDHLIISTWVISGEDILDIREWLAEGRIGKLDLYVGDIFPTSYKVEWAMLEELFADDGKLTGGGRLAHFRNHSKILTGIGPSFAFGCESSANITTNPRTENAVLTIDRGLYEFYREYFDGIISFKHGKI